MYTIPAPVRLTQTLLDISALIRLLLQEQVRDRDLTEAQWRVISFINGSQGLTQTQLALLLGIAKAPLGEHIQVLEQENLLRRETDTGDRRLKRLFLTDLGAKQADLLHRRFRRRRASYARELSDRMQADLATLSDLITDDSTRSALEILNMPSNLHLLGVLARRLVHTIRQELQAYDLTPGQWRILAQLLRSPAMKQKQLADTLCIAKAPLGKMITRLEQSNWVARQRCADDRRAQNLQVTTSGKQRLQRFYRELNTRLIPLDDFPTRRMERLIDDLQTLQYHLQDSRGS